ncbi:nucleoside diphosphate kinase regulator [Gilvimarinus xylanilyticus]|uniref:Nucleoside diphosphate kinase regulator n=1 Tax=Gilvimarinus xylanilyticus TaxID=2944139 RepID=A0A9X2I5V1_9GAMM|nr:nucleoside diphosphate kinase regulator [Gilvimarinus xylanilyticus]MCP8899447.1 nucleoside diphosphate kinase regulator [Gilvimarinus xylanilyticus]
MSKQPPIVIAESVYDAIANLIDERAEDAITQALSAELDRARIVTDKRLPADAVTIGSQVSFTVAATGKTFTYVLRLPRQISDPSVDLSVLSPVGSALIGLRQGQQIDWTIGAGKRTSITVTQVDAPIAA